ncbi:hypothetical protein AURDEDRAFT_174305 [Auricularia subglabra TFB-10046 SS5]|nr:hypothetical protein AURDEDRAFT_174305 [Auricularia subglabra TFB-10046 SS5]
MLLSCATFICPSFRCLVHQSLSIPLDEDDGTHFYAIFEVTELSDALDQFSRTLGFDDHYFRSMFVPQLASYCSRVVEMVVHYQFLTGLIEGLDALPELTTFSIDISDFGARRRALAPRLCARSGRRLRSRQRRTSDMLDALVLQSEDAEACASIDPFELMHLARDLSLLRDDREPSVVLYYDPSAVELVDQRFLGLRMIFVNEIWEADYSVRSCLQGERARWQI